MNAKNLSMRSGPNSAWWYLCIVNTHIPRLIYMSLSYNGKTLNFIPGSNAEVVYRQGIEKYYLQLSNIIYSDIITNRAADYYDTGV